MLWSQMFHSLYQTDIKILGVTFSNDFSFAAHIESVVKSTIASLQTLNGKRRFNGNSCILSMQT